MKTYTTKIAKNGATLYYSTETGKRIAKETALENERNYILVHGTVKERYELAKENFRFNERGEVERLWFHDVVSYGNRDNFKIATKYEWYVVSDKDADYALQKYCRMTLAEFRAEVEAETEETVEATEQVVEVKAGKFLVSVYNHSEHGNGMERARVETAQQAAQFVIDFAKQNFDKTVTGFYIKKFGKGHGEYHSTDADLAAIDALIDPAGKHIYEQYKEMRAWISDYIDKCDCTEEQAQDKCLAEYKAAKTVIDNAAKIAELKAAPENNVPPIVDEFSAKESELKENIGFALDAQADAAANLAYAKIAYDNAQFQFSVAEDIKIKAEQSYSEFVFSEAERLNKLPLVDAVCNVRDLCLTVVFDVKTQLFKVEHGIAPVAGAKITLGAFKTPAQVETFLQSLLPASNDTPPDKVEQIDGNKQIDPLAEIDAAEYAISPDALTLAVYEEEEQAYIARRKRETLADAKLAKAYAKARKVIRITRHKNGFMEWQARKKNGEWSRNEYYAKRKLGEFGIEWIEFLTFQEAEAEGAEALREKAPDSLARAMKIALLKVQEHCLRHDIKAAQREMALYTICAQAMKELGKGVGE